MNRRKLIIALCALCFAALPELRAQIGLEISLNRKVYMLYEPIYACVKIRNDSGRPLLFGKDPRLQGFVLFEIRDSRGQVVPQRKSADISVTGLLLGPGEVKNMVIPIQKYYDLDRCDDYSINVFVSHNQLPEEYQSRDTYFRIDSGVKVWSRTVGVADVSGESDGGQPAKERTYSVYALSEAASKFYYLVVEDKSHTYGVMRVGRAIGREKFSAEVDMLSRIHLLMPISPRVFHYLSFSIDGETIDNSYWKTSSTIPMLYRDPKSGMVARIGGAEARVGIDFRDPNRGTVTAAQILGENVDSFQPQPKKASGIVELGKGIK